MDKNIVILFLIIIFLGSAVAVYGYYTDWTFKPSALDNSKTLGCLDEPTEEMKSAHPNAVAFKANFERTACVPYICRAGYRLENDACVKDIDLLGCYKFNDVSFSIYGENYDMFEYFSKSDVFYKEGGVIKMDTIDDTAWDDILSDDIDKIFYVIYNNKLGYISNEKTKGLYARPVNSYKYMAVYNSKLLLFDEIPVSLERYEDTECNSLKIYSIPILSGRTNFDKMLNVQKNQEVDGYVIMASGGSGKTDLKCSGTEHIDTGPVPLETCKSMCDFYGDDCKGFTYYHDLVYNPTRHDADIPLNQDNWFPVDDQWGTQYALKNPCKLYKNIVNTTTSSFSHCYKKE